MKFSVFLKSGTVEPNDVLIYTPEGVYPNPYGNLYAYDYRTQGTNVLVDDKPCINWNLQDDSWLGLWLRIKLIPILLLGKCLFPFWCSNNLGGSYTKFWNEFTPILVQAWSWEYYDEIFA